MQLQCHHDKVGAATTHQLDSTHAQFSVLFCTTDVATAPGIEGLHAMLYVTVRSY